MPTLANPKTKSAVLTVDAAVPTTDVAIALSGTIVEPK
jgi:hypothetical protein